MTGHDSLTSHGRLRAITFEVAHTIFAGVQAARPGPAHLLAWSMVWYQDPGPLPYLLDAGVQNGNFKHPGACGNRTVGLKGGKVGVGDEGVGDGVDSAVGIVIVVLVGQHVGLGRANASGVGLL